MMLSNYYSICIYLNREVQKSHKQRKVCGKLDHSFTGSGRKWPHPASEERITSARIQLLGEVHSWPEPGSNVKQPFLTHPSVRQQSKHKGFVLVAGMQLVISSKETENTKFTTVYWKVCQDNVNITSGNTNSSHTNQPNRNNRIKSLLSSELDLVEEYTTLFFLVLQPTSKDFTKFYSAALSKRGCEG